MLSTLDSEQKKRLIVLVPDCLSGNIDLAHKVYWLAIREQREVLYLMLVDNDEKMIAISRSMATMKAITAGNCLVVNLKLVETNDWLRTLREIYQPGDRIVCHEEQLVIKGFLKTEPITKYIREKIDAHAISLSDFYHPRPVQITDWFRNLIAWFGFLVILAGFTALEIQLDHSFPGTLGSVLLAFLVIFEIVAIGAWDWMIGHRS